MDHVVIGGIKSAGEVDCLGNGADLRGFVGSPEIQDGWVILWFADADPASELLNIDIEDVFFDIGFGITAICAGKDKEEFLVFDFQFSV